ncbi:hypothetical protein [Leptospira wolffii]|uniref:hypothetical protein n=1 Tax=Leptospira wolffii TaxID=409998 RepID=UPI00034B5C7E|nr:hypothetical protein [Leptospira wolffii]
MKRILVFLILLILFLSCETFDRLPLRKVQNGKKEFLEGWSTCPKTKENETAPSDCKASLFANTIFIKATVPTPSKGESCLEQCRTLKGENGISKIAVESLPANTSVSASDFTYPRVPSACILQKSPAPQVYKTGTVRLPSSFTRRKERTEHCSCNLFIEYEKGESEFASIFRDCLDLEKISRKEQENFYYKYRY